MRIENAEKLMSGTKLKILVDFFRVLGANVGGKIKIRGRKGATVGLVLVLYAAEPISDGNWTVGSRVKDMGHFFLVRGRRGEPWSMDREARYPDASRWHVPVGQRE